MEGSGRRTFPTRFLSAEGCYSVQAVRSNLRIKIARKQAVGAELQPSAASSQARHAHATHTPRTRHAHCNTPRACNMHMHTPHATRHTHAGTLLWA